MDAIHVNHDVKAKDMEGGSKEDAVPQESYFTISESILNNMGHPWRDNTSQTMWDTMSWANYADAPDSHGWSN